MNASVRIGGSGVGFRSIESVGVLGELEYEVKEDRGYPVYVVNSINAMRERHVRYEEVYFK